MWKLTVVFYEKLLKFRFALDKLNHSRVTLKEQKTIKYYCWFIFGSKELKYLNWDDFDRNEEIVPKKKELT